MKNINFKKLLPHITAVVLFLGLALVYFYPVLEGLELNQGDIEKHKSMAHEINSHREKYDETALWSGNMFSGMPTYLTAKVKYSGEITKHLLTIAKGGLPHPASAIFAYLIGFFILFQCLRINPWLSIVGAIAFAFSSYFIIIIEAGHTSKTYAIAFMAPILGGFLETLRGRRNVGVLLIAVFTSIHLYVNHLQITYYLFFILLFVGLFELWYAIKSKEIEAFAKKMGFVLIGALIGVLPNIGNLMLTYEYSKQSTRGKTELTIEADGQSNASNVSSGLDKEYITQWSYGIDETFTLIVPNAKGGKSAPILGLEKEVERLQKEDPQFFRTLVTEYQNNQNAILSYFGDQPIVSGPVYIGIVVVALAILALIFLRDRLVMSLAAVTLLTIALSWGKNFMGLTEFFIDYVPGYNKFRAVAMILVVAEFTAPIMAILFLDRFIKDKELFEKNKKKLYIGLGAIALLVVGMAVSPSSFVDLASSNEMARIQQLGNQAGNAFQVQNAVEDYRADMVSASAWSTFKYLAIAVVFLLLYLFGKIKQNALIAGMGALILIDLWLVDKQYLNNEEANGRSASGTKYVNWTKSEDHVIPFLPSAVDQGIMNRELAINPELKGKLQQRLNEAKEKSGRLGNRKVYDLQFSELMEQTHYRIFNTNARLDQDVRTPFFHKTLGGYHGAKMKRYQELVDFQLGIEHYQLRQAFAQGGQNYVSQLLPSIKIANMLNAKYVIGPDNTGQSAEVVIENPNVYGNAWFVNQLKQVENADSSILALRTENLRQVAVIEQQDAANIQQNRFNPGSSDQIQLTAYSPNKMSYNYTASADQFAVFSEIYYLPGWTATVNGQEVPFTRVNYLLRGMNVPAGSGTIEFSFKPPNFTLGQTLIWISSVIILLFIGFMSFTVYKESTLQAVEE